MPSPRARNSLRPAASCRRGPRCLGSRTIISTLSSGGRSTPRGRPPMRTRSAILVSLWWPLALAIGGAHGKSPTLGKPITPADLAEWDIDIEPSGAGLPPGSGTAEQGAAIFADSCALCHGDGGKGGVFLGKGAPAARALVADKKINAIDESTKTIANYCPYATTLFAYIRRPM